MSDQQPVADPELELHPAIVSPVAQASINHLFIGHPPARVRRFLGDLSREPEAAHERSISMTQRANCALLSREDAGRSFCVGYGVLRRSNRLTPAKMVRRITTCRRKIVALA